MNWRYGLLLLMANSACACMCSGTWPSVKQAWQAAPGVFLGTVELADPDEDASQTMFQLQFVRIRVDEAFKGVAVGQIVELHQGANDCSAKFRTGERAVFYLYPGTTAGSWFVRACDHFMGSADPMGDDLLFLRRLPQSAIGTRLSGEVVLYGESPTESSEREGGVPNVKVTISSPQGFTRSVVTNSAGVYEVFGLSAGRYSVSIDVPRGLKTKFPLITGAARISGDDHAVQLPPDGGASVGFVLQADTRLSGRMLDSKGAPVKGVCVNLEPAGGRGKNGAYFSDCSKAGDTFKMEMMPPGSYWLIARDEVNRGGFGLAPNFETNG